VDRLPATATTNDKLDIWKSYIGAAEECLSPNGKNCQNISQKLLFL
jgi:hypothetical protein